MGACVIFGAGAIVMAAAMNLTVLIVGRVLAGIGIGFASQTVPVYIAESAPESIRGTLVSVDVLLITGGQFVSYVVDAIFLNVPGNWRWMLGLSFVPAFIQFVGMIFLPESPRWLALHLKEEKAIKMLRRTRITLEEADSEMEAIKETINQEKLQMQSLSHHRLVEMFLNRTIFHCLVIGVGMQIWQQVCGINTVMYYSSSILLAAGFGSEDDPATAIYCSMIVAFANMSMSVVAVVLIDRVGRRPLAIVSLIGVIGSLLLLSASFYGDGMPWLSLVSLILYIVFFAPGMGPIPWAVNSEIYPLFVRAPANSIATCANWVSNLIVSFTFLTLSDQVGETITFLIYAVIALLALFFVLFLLPETKGLSLEDVQSVFSRGWIIIPFCGTSPSPFSPSSPSSSSSASLPVVARNDEQSPSSSSS